MFEDLFGSWEKILLLVVILLIIFGGRRIPEIAQGLGKGIKEFKKAVKDNPEDSEKSERSASGGKDEEKKS